ncbi:MAG: DUF2232 domain-containing protein [Gemmatimonadaceae bacterium]|nr:DUF2232 domain-containing protein [Gemmatimonadaceae bacterium]
MTGAVAPDSAATAPRERGWRWFVLALLLMVVVTAAPGWTPALALLGGTVRLLLPIEQFALLVLVAIASCSVVGWWAGGRFSVAVLWVAMSVWVVWKLPLPFAGYGAFLRGWSLSIGASFGLICLTTRARPFLGRALAATALAAMVTIAGLVTRAPAAGAFDAATRMLGTEYQRRVQESLDTWKARTESVAWRAFVGQAPAAAARAEQMATTLGSLGDAGPSRSNGGLTARGPLLMLAPALLCLESLLALGLGWAAYHRLSRIRIGPPLAALRDLRFNDQLVWGLVVGATLMLLPTLAEWRAAGANLICFFGTLYALRGVGVLTWWIPDRAAALVPLALVVLVPLLGPVVVLAAVLATTFALGLGDTWRDFRAGAQARRPGSLR